MKQRQAIEREQASITPAQVKAKIQSFSWYVTLQICYGTWTQNLCTMGNGEGEYVGYLEKSIVPCLDTNRLCTQTNLLRIYLINKPDI
jgi:hypothetical protein